MTQEVTTDRAVEPPLAVPLHPRSVELLFKEYDHLCASYFESEAMGERRVNLFLAITAAVLAAFGMKDKGVPTDPATQATAACVLSALLVFGGLTLLRLMKRNLETTHCLHGLWVIRNLFLRSDDRLREFLAFRKEPTREKEWKELVSFGNGGLLECVMLINSLIFAGVVALCAHRLGLHTGSLLAAGMAGAVLLWVAQFCWVRYRYRSEAKKAATPGS